MDLAVLAFAGRLQTQRRTHQVGRRHVVVLAHDGLRHRRQGPLAVGPTAAGHVNGAADAPLEAVELDPLLVARARDVALDVAILHEDGHNLPSLLREASRSGPPPTAVRRRPDWA